MVEGLWGAPVWRGVVRGSRSMGALCGGVWYGVVGLWGVPVWRGVVRGRGSMGGPCVEGCSTG